MESDVMNNSDLIVNYMENNSEIINEYFCEGMNLKDFEKIILKKENIIYNKNEYFKIDFDLNTKYHYEDIEKIIYKLNNSKIVKLELLGKSTDLRNIYSLEIGNGDNITIFEAGIHSVEIANSLFIMKYVIDLVNKYENNDLEIIQLLNNNKIVILPFINPDGYEVMLFSNEKIRNKDLYLSKNKYFKFKCNANGVDLNRNMPSQNAGLYYKKNKKNSKIINKPSLEKFFPGFSLGSENETKILIYFQIKYYKKAKLYVSLHSMGRVIYAGKPTLASEFNEKCRKYGKIVSDLTNYKLYDINEEDEGYGNDGTDTDFIAELINGLKFSTKTGRLCKNKYEEKINKPLYKGAVILIESMNVITNNLNLIKLEYEKFKLDKVYTSLIKN